jgi:hypothetical protein
MMGFDGDRRNHNKVFNWQPFPRPACLAHYGLLERKPAAESQTQGREHSYCDIKLYFSCYDILSCYPGYACIL